MHRLLFSLVVFAGCARVEGVLRQSERPPPSAEAIARFSRALSFHTVSVDGRPDASGTEFLRFHEYLQRSYPLVHQALTREVVGQYSLLFTWRGTDPSAPALLLSAHQDVVPVDSATAAQWRHDAFSGEVEGDAVWGRGARDDKGNLLAMFEAIERLLAAGFQPTQTVYLACGHDEEMGTSAGQRGARAIASLLKARGVRVQFVLDEGLVVAEGMTGLDAPAALVGVAEKGYLTVAITAQGPAGHSSSPSMVSAIGRLSQALVRIEQHPMPARLGPVARALVARLAPHFSGLKRFVMSNVWLFEPLVVSELSATPSGSAMLRTTSALTRLTAGEKESTVPGIASAQVNFRLMPGDSVETVLAHLRAVIDDATIELTPLEPHWAPSPISASDGAAYLRISRAVSSVFPDAVVAPGLMVGATDSRAYVEVADAVYRFSPARTRLDELAQLHGVDERLALGVWGEMIEFYEVLLRDRAP